jgi:hypothetical protein
MLEYKGEQVLISDILHDAADIFLRETRYDEAPQFYKYVAHYGSPAVIKEGVRDAERYSCCAVDAAIAYHFKLERWSVEAEKLGKQVKKGLRAMGCPVGSSSAFVKYGDAWEYDNTKVQGEVQGMRYFWLKWAAMMAEEQGV